MNKITILIYCLYFCIQKPHRFRWGLVQSFLFICHRQVLKFRLRRNALRHDFHAVCSGSGRYSALCSTISSYSLPFVILRVSQMLAQTCIALTSEHPALCARASRGLIHAKRTLPRLPLTSSQISSTTKRFAPRLSRGLHRQRSSFYPIPP